MQIPRRKKEELSALKRQSDEPIYLTPQGIEQLKAKLARLKRELPIQAQETSRTADYGDRSENAEYKDAKARLRRTQAQIFYTEDQLKRVVAIKSDGGTSGKVALGSTVTLELSDGTRKTFQILGTRETNPGAGRISHESPLGKVLMGRNAGETVTIQAPNGVHTYRIIEII